LKREIGWWKWRKDRVFRLPEELESGHSGEIDIAQQTSRAQQRHTCIFDGPTTGRGIQVMGGGKIEV
jgi:hypothetical protein